jgi:hypothetical protein
MRWTRSTLKFIKWLWCVGELYWILRRTTTLFSYRQKIFDIVAPELRGSTPPARVAYPDAFFYITRKDMNRMKTVLKL